MNKQVRRQNRMGRQNRMDLRISDRRRGDRVQNAQQRVEINLLHHKARRVPRNSSDQPHRSSPPGSPVGNRLSGNLLLQKQCAPRNSPPQIPPAHSLPQRRNLPIHIHLPRRLLFPPCSLPLLRPVHRPRSQRRIPFLPPHHHSVLNTPLPPRSQMVRNRIRRMVAKRTVLGNWRHQCSSSSGYTRSAQSSCWNRNLIHFDVQIGR